MQNIIMFVLVHACMRMLSGLWLAGGSVRCAQRLSDRQACMRRCQILSLMGSGSGS